MTFERATELMKSKTPVFTFFAPVSCGAVMIHNVKQTYAEIIFLTRDEHYKETCNKSSRWLDELFETESEAYKHRVQKLRSDIQSDYDAIAWHQMLIESKTATLNVLLSMEVMNDEP